MVTDQTLDAIWLNLLNANRHVRYYLAVQKFNLGFERFLLASILVAGTSAAATALGEFSSEVQATFPLMMAAVSIWFTTGKYGVKAALAQSIAVNCKQLEDEWHNLYREAIADLISDETARKSRTELVAKIRNATSESTKGGLTSYSMLNWLSAKAANKELTNDYASR